MSAKSISLSELKDSLNSIIVTQKSLISGQQDVKGDLSRLQQYTESGFEIVNDRFDRLEDRFDQLESALPYQH